MYLTHFALSHSPFSLRPETTCFFGGEQRKEILAALVHALVTAQGISLLVGASGSGKTVLCKMLQETLPATVQTVYLSDPAVSREEMLCAIAAALGLPADKNRIGLIIRDIQKCLQYNAENNKRIVVLVDEAQSLPIETLEGLCQLYKLQENAMQIALFAQPSFSEKLNQAAFSKINALIQHTFSLSPLSAKNLESYLMFRLTLANYHREALFSSAALKLLGQAAQGVIRRINTLADKSLLAAFIENSNHIEARHVVAAMRDQGLALPRAIPEKKRLLASSGIVLTLLLIAFSWWNLGETTPPRADTSTETNAQTESLITHQPNITAEQASPVSLHPLQSSAPILAKSNQRLYEKRLAASETLLAQHPVGAAIQLFYHSGTRSAKLDDFLQNAEKIGKLNEVFLLHSNDGIRVLYGNYSSAEAARAAIKTLPASYQENFAASIYSF